MSTCIVADCPYQAKYGKQYSNIREYCYIHRPSTYIDLTLPICIYKDADARCQNIAKYKVDNDVEFCQDHAPDIAIEARKKCIIDGCNKTANYGLCSTMIKEYCFMHYDSTLHVSLTKKTCAYEACKHIAMYANTSDKKRYCRKHIDSVYLQKYTKCSVFRCKRIAYYGLPNGRAMFCLGHYDINKHVCVQGRPCKNTSCKELIVGRATRCSLNHLPMSVLKKYKSVVNSASNLSSLGLSLSLTGDVTNGATSYLPGDLTSDLTDDISQYLA